MPVLNLRPPTPAPVHLRVLAVAVSLAAAVGCSGITNIAANYDTVTYHLSVFALNGSPVGAVTAINTPTTAAVRTDASYDFDVAFDLDASGRPVALTQRFVGNPYGSAGHQVSLQLLTGAFAGILELPTSGWVADSVLTLTAGQVLGVRTGALVCLTYASPYMYSKMMVDSVNVALRRLWITTVTDPNCGFRGVDVGRPVR
jgi:hypothetical protein